MGGGMKVGHSGSEGFGGGGKERDDLEKGWSRSLVDLGATCRQFDRP